MEPWELIAGTWALAIALTLIKVYVVKEEVISFFGYLVYTVWLAAIMFLIFEVGGCDGDCPPGTQSYEVARDVYRCM